MKVTFVCTGNICRSPLAEGILRHLAPNIVVSSSGIEGYHAGEKPDYRAIKIAQSNGISIENIIAKKITLKDLEENDYIFALTAKHKEKILKHCPKEFAHKIHVLLEFTDTPNTWNNDVNDPYYGTDKDFKEVFNLILEACRRFLDKTRFV
jgi:protein-tyrosine phosphatase